jgi:two-component system chemotaxis response regulator CheB
MKIVVIDDSAFMRKSLTLMLESDPEIKVVATAREGREGIEKIKRFRPDLVTLDIEMPGMNGLEALKVLMQECPLPVLMVSSLTTDGADATVEALAMGAMDFISKDLSHVSVNIVMIKDELIAKIKSIVRSPAVRNRFYKSPARIDTSRSWTPAPVRNGSMDVSPAAIVVGVSTGGPHALLRLLPRLPASFPIGIAVVQHMPPHFTKSMAERLDSVCKLGVKEAESGDVLKAGSVLIAPGGKHLTFVNDGRTVSAIISEEPGTTLYRPSADVMMTSAVSALRRPIVGLIMTGMGKDGLEGLKTIKSNGGYIIAQDEQSCVVYGMPKAAVDEGIVDTVVPLDCIADSLIRLAEYTPAILEQRTV